MGVVHCSLWKTHNQIVGRSVEGHVEYENREQIGKSLLNRFVMKCTVVHLNPAGLGMGLFGFFLLEKRDPLGGVIESCEKLSSIGPRVYQPRCTEKSGEKKISEELDNNMI